MEKDKIRELEERVARLRREAEALAEEKESFPAIWRNAVRILAAIKLMELNLGDAESLL